MAAGDTAASGGAAGGTRIGTPPWGPVEPMRETVR